LEGAGRWEGREEKGELELRRRFGIGETDASSTVRLSSRNTDIALHSLPSFCSERQRERTKGTYINPGPPQALDVDEGLVDVRVLGHKMQGEVQSKELRGENVRGGFGEDVNGVLDC